MLGFVSELSMGACVCVFDSFVTIDTLFPFSIKLAYRDWLCSVSIPYHDDHGQLVKPCQSICEQVEQKCPHLHPHGKDQYAGEPVFLCIGKSLLVDVFEV